MKVLPLKYMHSVLVFDDVEAAGGVFPDGLVVPADVVGWDVPAHRRRLSLAQIVPHR